MQNLFPLMCSSTLAKKLDIKKYLYIGLILNKTEEKFFSNSGILFLLLKQSIRQADSRHLERVSTFRILILRFRRMLDFLVSLNHARTEYPLLRKMVCLHVPPFRYT